MTCTIQTAYNDASQALVTTTPTTVAVLGTQVCDAGCAVDTVTNGFKILSRGVYRVSYDVEMTASTAGTATVALYNGTTALPCATVSQYVADTGSQSVHVETTLPIAVCAMIRPVISAQVSGIAGAVTHVCASVTKVA